MNATSPRSILVTMPDSVQRRELVKELSARGDRVFICSAPWTGEGSCALMRNEVCALVSMADAAIVSGAPTLPAAAGSTTLCAVTAPHPVVVDGKPVYLVISALDEQLAAD